MFVAKNADQLFSVYNNISKMMYNDNWYEPLKTNGPASQRPIVDDFLSAVLSSDTYIENVFFVPSSDGELNFTSRKAKVFAAQLFPLDDIMKQLDGSPDQLIYVSTHSEAYFRGSDKKVMTFARHLLDTSSILNERPTIIGTVVFDVDISVFENIFSQVVLAADDEIDMVTAAGQISYSNNQARIGSMSIASNADEQAETERIVTAALSNTQQIVVGRFSRKDFFGIFEQFKGIAALTVGICIVFLLLLALVFSRRFSRPIRDVMKQMVKMESGILDVNLPVKSEDELGQLIRGMNRMAEKLNQFIQVAYVAQIKQEKAELNALKSQIRPHYLYNTLEVIRMSAVHHDDMDVADMIHALSNQLEYVLDYGENIVELHRELRNVEDYFALIQVRYEEQIRLCTTTSSDVSLDWGIIKLSLQPLIENAVQHGIAPKGDGGYIQVSMKQEAEQTLCIEVLDDGMGMSEERVRELNKGFNEAMTERGSHLLGLRNVHERIQTHFGKQYGLEVSSKLGEGTSVKVRIPIVEEVELRGINRVYGG
ncbi:sensor histidine kinase [Paenibacillus ferrarius]|uniref:sensor histidine kinase n=1 Tax=Paenibacillus ferrarius TaxID=1469647 RepID=UPI003D2C1DB9